MPVPWLALTALALYVLLGWQFCRTRLAAAAPARPGLENAGLLLALALHGLALWPPLANPPLHFGAAEALSMTAWLALLVYLVGQLSFPLDGLQPPLLALVIALLGASLLLPAGHLLTYPQNALSRLHFLAAMLAYGLLANAAGIALLMRIADQRLHRADAHLLVQKLPPLMSLERLLFACIGLGFGWLTLALATGALFSEEVFGKALQFNHKIVLSFAAWLVFGGLLIGRHLKGWRGRTATRTTLIGFCLLLLAYIGSRLVFEAILQRA
ncbi:cytochrome c biogenesis protein CcsA [Chitiniphilus purpureus]|uniref:Cytochrome c biogenesis protein CcsA n=1 Tax=Chitiniphilus purpureus TaxID=2981137 RepID=A0ABY6DQT2_9NEIS|nr:cytochrome c biogenesis protein CcsA [Chitiniphilus sp. CD1]UXY16593.1 cytochrome c biogenesis protein CcsA [Chitiniphilus sp. CD1]